MFSCARDLPWFKLGNVAKTVDGDDDNDPSLLDYLRMSAWEGLRRGGEDGVRDANFVIGDAINDCEKATPRPRSYLRDAKKGLEKATDPKLIQNRQGKPDGQRGRKPEAL